jgi:hypothetical protein
MFCIELRDQTDNHEMADAIRKIWDLDSNLYTFLPMMDYETEVEAVSSNIDCVRSKKTTT